MNEQTYFLKKRISELNCFVEKFNIFAKFTSQQLNEHFPLKSRMPGLFYIVQPFFTNWTTHEKFRSCQIGKNMIRKHLRRNFTELRNSIEMKWIFTLDSHKITVTHLEFQKSLCWIVLNDVRCIREKILKAMAVRLDILESP